MDQWLSFCLKSLARQQPVILASNTLCPPPLHLPIGPVWACTQSSEAGYTLPGRPQTQLQQAARILLSSDELSRELSIPLNPWTGDSDPKHNLQIHLRRLEPKNLQQLMLLDGKLRLGQSCQFDLHSLAIEDHGKANHPLCVQARRVTRQLVSFAPSDSCIAIFGAGALAHQIVSLLSDSAVDIYWEAASSECVPVRNAANIIRVEPSTVNPDWLPRNSNCLVMTHDHELDFKLCANLAKLPHVSSVGMVGSKRKCDRLQLYLSQEQLNQQQSDKIRCPIGSINTLSLNAAALTIAHEIAQLTADTYYTFQH